jgi:prephenate dehydrogenase
MNLAQARLTIFGLGLMGGSLAHALQGHCAQITAVDPDPETRALARRLGLVHWATDDVHTGLTNGDILILATPVRAILDLLDQFQSMSSPYRIVLDIGSTKTQIVKAMETLPETFDPVGGHPLCGKEVAGLKAADPMLFRRTRFVLTPLPRSSQLARGLALELIRALGAEPIFMAAEHHDDLLATSSHLPYLLASTLVAHAGEVAKKDPRLWQMAASGFRDSSRLAASDVRMMLDILMTNRGPIFQALKQSGEQITQFANLLVKDDPNELHAILEELRAQRQAHFNPDPTEVRTDESDDLWPGA